MTMRWIAAILLALMASTAARAQHIHRNNFEANKTAWTAGPSDAPNEVITHANTDQGAHGGLRSEYIQLKAQPGKTIYYVYPIGKAPLTEELTGGLWLKANRPLPELSARIILPNERDVKNLEAPLSTLFPGDAYRNTGRWQRLSIGRLQKAKEQLNILQAEINRTGAKRQLNLTDAYVDAILLNVYGGPGPTEVWIDDLEIGPVLNDVTPPNLPGNRATPVSRQSQPSANSRSAVEFNGSQLLVGGRPFFMRGIRLTDTPIAVLNQAGFNTIFVDASADPKVLKEAADLGMWVVPMLPILSEDPRFATSEGLTREVQRLSEQDSILFWHMGRTLSFEQVGTIQRAAQVIRQADPGRPLGGDVWDGLLPYSRTLNVNFIHRWPLMTTLDLARYREWIDMRRRLMNPGAYSCTWIQTHVPDFNAQLIYGQSGNANFTTPVGPQPEQVRLLTYSALASGCKGVAFWSDRFLADSHLGRDRLLECALLNQEIEMLEPLLTAVDDQAQWIETSQPEVKAAVLRTSKGILVLPMLQGTKSQYVLSQGAASKLTFVVPQVPGSMQAWEVLPGDVRGLVSERVVGGTKVTVPEFGLTTAIVFTSDTNLIVRFQEGTRSRRQQAAQWTYDLAAYTLDKTLKVEAELESIGHTQADNLHLINDAKGRLDAAKKMWDTKLFSESFRESQRALRPARILMRGQWNIAVKDLDSPVSSPYALSFYTLPKHWELMDQVKTSTAGKNVLPGGDFEGVPANPQDAWKIEEPTLDEVETFAIRVGAVDGPLEPKKDGIPATTEQPKEGKQCALLQIKSKKGLASPLVLERTLLALTSPTVKMAPGTLVRVSAWVRIPSNIGASVDGALFYDSVGGEPLAIRMTDATPWKKLTLYRRIPESGQISVTLAMTGLGSVYFDDVRIEPMLPAGAVEGNLTSNPKSDK